MQDPWGPLFPADLKATRKCYCGNSKRTPLLHIRLPFILISVRERLSRMTLTGVSSDNPHNYYRRKFRNWRLSFWKESMRVFLPKRKQDRWLGTCLVVRWLRICLPIQGTLGSIPRSGRFHTAKQLNLCATASEPSVLPETGLCNRRSHQWEAHGLQQRGAPSHRNWRKPKSSKAVQTWCSQK